MAWRGVAHACVSVVSAVVCAALVVAVPSGGASSPVGGRTAVAPQTAAYTKRQQVFAVFDEADRPGRIIVNNAFAVSAPGTIADVDGNGNATTLTAAQSGSLTTQTVLAAGAKALPWKLTVTYSLNGPDADRRAVTGANGLVGVRIRLDADPLSDTRYFRDAMPIVTFTVPHDVTDAVAAPDGAIVTDDGDAYRVTGVGVAGQSNEWYCYLNARNFRMGRIVVAAVPADAADTDGQGGVRERLTALARGAEALAGSLTNAGSGEHQALIDRLAALRDEENATAAAEIAAKHDAYVKQFGVYIDRYVRSYSSHLSGAPGTKTQMGALIGMTGELTGSTPLAQSVTDLANAVNAMSAAHEHTGAANVLDEVIAQIRRRGTTGLLADLKTRQAKEANAGKTQYAKGQGQLANAMIPFSMAYTDTYTARLNDLVNAGGSVAGSEQAAIDQTNQAFGTDETMQRITGQISAALRTMAGASEHTGAANMLGRIVDEFGAQLEGDAAASTGESGPAVESGSGGPSVPFATVAATGALRPQDETALLTAGAGGLIDESTTLGDCAKDLDAAVTAILPQNGQPSDVVTRAIAHSASRVRATDGGGSAGVSPAGSDVVSAANTHTVSASFMLVLPAVGDDSLSAAGSGEHADAGVDSSIPGLSAIVNKFMG